MVTPDAKRDAVAHACATHGVSQRRACSVLSVGLLSMRYRRKRPNHARIHEAMKQVVVDDFMRECLALVADTSLSGRRLSRELDAIITQRGKPRTIVSDNGTEMASMAILN